MIACINNGEQKESAAEEERQAGWAGWDESDMGQFMEDGWGGEGET